MSLYRFFPNKTNILYISVISLTIIIFILFYIFNILIRNNNEHFELEEDGLLCGTSNDICRINEMGISSCCDGFFCVRKEGNFHHKICVNKNELNQDISGTDSGLNNYIVPENYTMSGLLIPGLNIDDYYNLICCNSLINNNVEFKSDTITIDNILLYLNGLPKNQTNQFIINLKSYLIQLNDPNITNKEPVEKYIDKNDSYKIPNFIILGNINNYLNYLHLPSTSLLISLNNYINKLNININLYENYLNNTVIISDDSIKTNLLNYLNSPNVPNSAGINSLKIYIYNINNDSNINKLTKLLNGIILNKPPNKDVVININNYLNIINLQNNSVFINLKSYMNGLNLQKDTSNMFDLSILNNIKKYINGLKINNSVILDNIKLYFKDITDKTKINNLNLYLQSLTLLDGDSSNIVIIKELNNYLNSLNISDTSILINFKNYINRTDLPITSYILYDNYISTNILTYINTLNLQNSFLITNMQIYLMQLKTSTGTQNLDNFKNYLASLNSNIPEMEVNIILNIQNYLNSINIPVISSLADLKIFIKDLPYNNGPQNDYLVNMVIINSIKNYLNVINLPNNINITNFKNYLNGINQTNQIDFNKVKTYINDLNTKDETNIIVLKNIKLYLNNLSVERDININNLKNNINGINISDKPTAIPNYFNENYNLNFLSRDFWKNIIFFGDENNNIQDPSERNLANMKSMCNSHKIIL